MTTLDPELEHYGVAIGPGMFVIDIGASTGGFAIPAQAAGADVLCVEALAINDIRLRELGLDAVHVAAGERDGWGTLIEAAGDRWRTESHVEPGWGVRVLSLASILAIYSRPVDVLKVDIEGGEYALFAGADRVTMGRIRTVTIDTHRWTVDGELPVEGIVRRSGSPYVLGCGEALVAKLAETHTVTVVGPLDAGATVIGVLR